MQSKRTIILTILVIVIWGTIGYSIYNSLSSSDEMDYRNGRVAKKQEAKISRSDFALSLNYPDPFQMQGKKDENRKALIQVRTQPVKQIVKEQTPIILISWDKVQYMAAFFNASKNYTVATILLEGTEYMVKEGDHIGDYTIMSIARDSLLISYGTQKKYIKKNK